MPGRAIMNPFMQHVMAGEKIPHSPCHRCLAKCSPGEIPYCNYGKAGTRWEEIAWKRLAEHDMYPEKIDNR